MRVQPVARRDAQVEGGLDRFRGFARRKARTVRDPEHMGIDSESLLPERHVEHHVRRLAAHPGKRLKRLAVHRHLAAVLVPENTRQVRDVPGLGSVQANGPDERRDPVLAKIRHPGRRVRNAKQGWRRAVHAFIGSLGGKDDGDEERERIVGDEFSLRFRLRLPETGEHLLDLRLLQFGPQHVDGLSDGRTGAQ